MIELDSVGASQKERLKYIDYHAFFLGKIGRKDLIDRFGIAMAAATRDFTQYNEIRPANLVYAPNMRSYIASEKFQPAFKYPALETLEQITKDFVDPDFFHERELRLGRIPSVNIIAKITRAIYLKKIIEVKYLSTSSGETTKILVPHALIDNGLLWQIRAYDKNKKRFADFLLARVSSTKIMDGEIHAHESVTEDKEWNQVVTLRLKAHEEQNHPEAIEFEFDMKNGFLEKKIRSRLAGYFLRRWNVDCSLNGLKGQEYQLRLVNIPELKEVDSLGLAPGYNGSAT